MNADHLRRSRFSRREIGHKEHQRASSTPGDDRGFGFRSKRLDRPCAQSTQRDENAEPNHDANGFRHRRQYTVAVDKPIVLLSPDVVLHGDIPRKKAALALDYQAAIADAGGTPLIASPFAEPKALFDLADGWLLTGGDDLPAELYGQRPNPKNRELDPIRLEAEKRLYQLFFPSQKPILGICFGAQFLNVMSGGSLIQHLPEVLGNEDRKDGTTCIELAPNSRLTQAGLPARFEARCFHHQAIDKIGHGWREIARASDGVIEAIEWEGGEWRVGVQWHPERSAESDASRKLFAAFVMQCATRC